MNGMDILPELKHGDPVIARGTRLKVHGSVDLTAPHLGVLWVREFGTGERQLLNAAEINIERGRFS